ncbi:MAG: secretin N-terminal domain-containing protein [Gammaproteobacteria bacterium]
MRAVLLGFLLVFTMLFGQMTLAQNTELELTTLTLKNRQPQDIVNVLEPFVGPGGQIKAFDNQLIIQTTPENLVQLKTMIEKLDQPAAQLTLTVSQSHEAPSEREFLFLRENRKESKTNFQQIKVLSGNTAHISTGERISLGLLGESRIQSGIMVQPTLTGSQVSLTITTVDQTPEEGLRHTSTESHTTIVVPLDKWINLGRIDIEREEKARVLFLETSEQAKEFQHIWLRVQLDP